MLSKYAPKQVCLAEAKSYVGIRVADKASGQTFIAHTPSACALGPVTTKVASPAQGSQPTNDSNVTGWDNFKEKVYFAPHVRGAVSEWKNVECEADTANCKLVGAS